MGSIELGEGDRGIVLRWWDSVHVQHKSNPFSIASILARPASANPECASSQTPQKKTLDPRHPSTRWSNPSQQRSRWHHLPPENAPKVSAGFSGTDPRVVERQHPRQHGHHAQPPGESLPKTPATPTVKDYRSDFEKRVLKSPVVSGGLPSTSFLNNPAANPKPGPITVTAPSVTKQQNISLLDLPMPNLLPGAVEKPKTEKPKTKKRKKEYLSSAYQDLDLVTGDSNYRKYLTSRSPVAITRLPSLCQDRVRDSADIKTVDNYRLDSIIGEGTFGQVFKVGVRMIFFFVSLPVIDILNLSIFIFSLD